MASSKAVFQIRKYSWSNDNTGNSKANYRHLTANNIFLVLEGDQTARGRLKLQIVQGTSVLNEIDLGKHIDTAISTRETFRRVNRQVADKQLPTYAVASGTKLAITHRPEDGSIHRMQVAVFSSEDCNKIVDHLRFRGMVFVEASRQHSNRPGTTESDLRSINTNVSALLAPRHTPGGFSSTSQSRSSEQQSGNGHYSSEHVHPSALTPSNTYAPSFLAQRSNEKFLVRDENAAPRVLNLDHPTASQVYPRVSASTQAAAPRSDPGLAIHSDDARKWVSSLADMTSQHITDLNRFRQPAPVSPFSNAMTTAASPSTSLWPPTRSLQDLLPPDRELPFEANRRERSRSSSVLSLTALPKPQLKKPTSAHSESPKLDISSSDRITRSKRKQVEAEASRQQVAETVANGPTTKDMPPPQLLRFFDPDRSSPKDMNELLYGKRPRLSTSIDVAQTTPVQEPGRTSESEPQATSLLTSLASKVMQTSEAVDLESYTKLDITERKKVLEKFMLDMLGNKDFTTLCEDMSVCWQRLALGL